MYGYFGIQRVVTGFVTIALLAFAVLIYTFGWHGWESVRIRGPQAMTVTSLIFAALGNPRIYALVATWTPLRWSSPKISGFWEGELRSNWAEVSARSIAGEQAMPTALVPVNAYINASLFHAVMELESANGRYSRSQTIALRVARDPETDLVQLRYLYKNSTPAPLKTDEQVHYGAALLNFSDRNGVQELEGFYWTNRNWQKGLNTAGTIRLRRPGTIPREQGEMA